MVRGGACELSRKTSHAEIDAGVSDSILGALAVAVASNCDHGPAVGGSVTASASEHARAQHGRVEAGASDGGGHDLGGGGGGGGGGGSGGGGGGAIAGVTSQRDEDDEYGTGELEETRAPGGGEVQQGAGAGWSAAPVSGSTDDIHEAAWHGLTAVVRCSVRVVLVFA